MCDGIFRVKPDVLSRPAGAGANLLPTNFSARGYRSIIADDGLSRADGRKETIEIQLKDAIELSSKTVLAVALPREFQEDHDWVRRIKVDWGAKIIPFDVFNTTTEGHVNGA